ncbi:hypothetical protein EVAR_39153_1 [Eumeta japonica]|uniref:DDE-1 domain-containing protein n=1 Tax=Eumeta variegata TaxID=151549 RepID=A0A4C1XA06_EUMVA|nr:hypothetical protein EVAR_39153_1 [Eumeta japonica]
MLEAACNNDMILFCLPSHATSALQPLDRAVFGAFKTFYNAEINSLVTNSGYVYYTVGHKLGSGIDKCDPDLSKKLPTITKDGRCLQNIITDWAYTCVKAISTEEQGRLFGQYIFLTLSRGKRACNYGWLPPPSDTLDLGGVTMYDRQSPEPRVFRSPAQARLRALDARPEPALHTVRPAGQTSGNRVDARISAGRRLIEFELSRNDKDK